MKPIYIFSSEPFCGKTAIALALANSIQKTGLNVGYYKPVSINPLKIGDKWVDEDAHFVQVSLPALPEGQQPESIFLPKDKIDQALENPPPFLHQKIKETLQKIPQSLDVLLIEGGSTFFEGYALGISVQQYTDLFGCCGLLITRYHNDMNLIDTILFAKSLLGDHLRGVIINRVPPDLLPHIMSHHIPSLEQQGISVFSAIPEDRRLTALSVNEIIDVLHPQILTRIEKPQALVESLTIGAMSAEAALSRFRKQSNKAVITGGDRTDIQLAALETSTSCLILTGNLHPSPLIIRQAEELQVPILLVPTNTMETIEQLERVMGKTRLAQPEKLNFFMDLFEKYTNFQKLLSAFEISNNS